MTRSGTETKHVLHSFQNLIGRSMLPEEVLLHLDHLSNNQEVENKLCKKIQRIQSRKWYYLSIEGDGFPRKTRVRHHSPLRWEFNPTDFWGLTEQVPRNCVGKGYLALV